ncbi:MAG: hypothetical protein J6U86_06825 [Clostridia bacterium]|nr:hypothetical protein [Clostridia bacterium]
MNQSIDQRENQSVGYLTVRVSTAGGAVPLEGAAVNIRGGDVDNSSIIYSLSTNSDGLTPTVTLDTAPRSASQTPQGSTPPYVAYNIDVFARGYAPAFFHNVPIFEGINSVQPAVLLPNIENERYSNAQHVTESPLGGVDI